MTTPDKTRRAAKAAAKPTAGTLRARVFEAIFGAKLGMTDEEVQDLLGMSANTQRPRRRELVQAGAIVASGSGSTAMLARAHEASKLAAGSRLDANVRALP